MINPWLKKFFSKIELQKLVAPLLLVVLCIIISLLSPYFLTVRNFVNLGKQTSIYLIIACGQTVAILSAGIDLSVGSIVALSACTTGLLFQEGITNIWVGAFIGIVLGVMAGLFNGVVIAYGRVPPFIATLGSMGIVRGLVLLITKGYPTGMGFPDSFRFIGEEQMPIIITGLIVIISWVILSQTIFGRRIYAIGDNREAARLSGVRVGYVTIMVFAFSGLMSALAGVVMAARLNSAPPAAGIGYELNSIAAVVIGGTDLFGGQGGIGGTIVGAFLMSIIANALNLLNVSPFWQQIVIGAVVIAAVMSNTLRFRR